MNTTPHPDYQPRTLLPCRAVLFDCDGVLVNSEEIIFNSWSRWAQQVGVNPDEVLASIHGRRSQDTVAAFIEPARRPEALALIDYMEIEDATNVTPIPGAIELLNSIPEGRKAIFTSGSRALASARLDAAGISAPNVVITGQDVTHGKPHPEGYLTAAERLGIDPRDCVVVEDAIPGIQAARAANVRSILGIGHQDLGEDQPNLIISDLRMVRWTPAGLLIAAQALWR